jgi:thiosulfate dehydrogenase [quinone] large subunit
MAAKTTQTTVYQDPKFVIDLMNTPKFAWLWLIARVWLGWAWIEAGWHKTQEAPWVQTGMAVRGYWERAVAIPEKGRPLITFDWYRDFLNWMLAINAHVVMGKLIAWGEVLVGVALIVGALVGVAAFFGALMNWNFMLAGSASSNPVLFLVAVLLILAWKVAGYYGLDRILLPMLGTPWRPGKVFTPAPSRA